MIVCGSVICSCPRLCANETQNGIKRPTLENTRPQYYTVGMLLKATVLAQKNLVSIN